MTDDKDIRTWVTFSPLGDERNPYHLVAWLMDQTIEQYAFATQPERTAYAEKHLRPRLINDKEVARPKDSEQLRLL